LLEGQKKLKFLSAVFWLPCPFLISPAKGQRLQLRHSHGFQPCFPHDKHQNFKQNPEKSQTQKKLYQKLHKMLKTDFSELIYKHPGGYPPPA
jgi:hypothetical protein